VSSEGVSPSRGRLLPVLRRVVPWLAGLALLAIYLPDVGHGFVRDDFSWIRNSIVTGPRDVLRLFSRDNGFFRPMVALTFALDHALFGLQPRAYGLTNLFLLLLAAAAVWALGRSLTLSAGTALFAAALWVFNPHGIPMALLWISGRTSLVLTLFAVLAATLVVRGRPLAAGLATFLALLSKEEAVVLPLVLFAWAGLWSGSGLAWNTRRALTRSWPALLAWAPYFVLRAQTRAYLPGTAPSFYRPSIEPALVLQNVLEYADRSATFAAVVLILLGLLAWRRPRLEARHKGLLVLGGLWLVAGFALTVFLPLRSSLYACFPSVGVALAGAAVGEAVWRDMAAGRRALVLSAAALLPFALLPVYWSRAGRWVQPAELSARVLGDLQRDPSPPSTLIVLHDVEGVRNNLAGAFGTLLDEAVLLHAPGRRVWIEPPPAGWQGAGLKPPRPGEAARRLFLREGHLVGPPG
jgi:hypothetical protein